MLFPCTQIDWILYVVTSIILLFMLNKMGLPPLQCEIFFQVIWLVINCITQLHLLLAVRSICVCACVQILYYNFTSYDWCMAMAILKVCCIYYLFQSNLFTREKKEQKKKDKSGKSLVSDMENINLIDRNSFYNDKKNGLLQTLRRTIKFTWCRRRHTVAATTITIDWFNIPIHHSQITIITTILYSVHITTASATATAPIIMLEPFAFVMRREWSRNYLGNKLT